MMPLHPGVQWLVDAMEAGVHLLSFSPGQKRPIPPRPFIAILIDDGVMDVAPTGPAGFDRAILGTLLDVASSSILVVGLPHERVFAAAVSMASSGHSVVVVETTREFEAAWIELLNSRATLLPPVAAGWPEARQ